MPLNPLSRAVVMLLALFCSCSVRSENEGCETSNSLVLSGSYKMLSRCSSDHIGEALRLGEGCEPRPTILRLPWPQNSSQIDQVGSQR